MADNPYRRGGRLTKWLLIAISFAFTLLMLVLPLVQVLAQAFDFGFGRFWAAVSDEYTIKALKLSLITMLFAVGLNTLFGLAAAWAITRFRFWGKGFLITLIDIPFAVSPVIAGLVFIMTFGRLGWAYPFLEAHNIKIVFATPGLVLATIFVTLPFVARELIPVMISRGTDEEEAALILGGGFFQLFRQVTFPHLKWALLYGVVLCTARALGEFGAVSVVSGHLRGKTNTLPLHVEILFREYHTAQAFSVATILVAMAIVILILRTILEHISQKDSEA
ncbi:MAG: sulfate ABC transporter permease subunit CysW [Deltaproteobacteria bacterium]|jgi:sulfate transport system permease protein|nr:sulfate ABC transporter permease subunit CysW [Deltaproteobacteria bacterium]